MKRSAERFHLLRDVIECHTDFADVKQVSGAEGSRFLIVEVIVDDELQKMIGCITEVERACIPVLEEKLVLIILG